MMTTVLLRPRSVAPAVRVNRVIWLRALCSGRYRQGQGTLVSIDGEGRQTFCCLGVGRKVLKGCPPLRGEDACYLREGEAKALGLGGMSDQQVLADWNDTEGLDFVEIADRLAQWWGIPAEEYRP